MVEEEEKEKEGQAEFNQFEWYYKKEFKWKCIANNNYKRLTYLGGINEVEKATIMKLIKVDAKSYKTLLKEVYFLSCFKRNIYFTEIIDTFLSNECEKLYLYIILREEGTDLKSLIEKNDFNYNEKIPNISRYIFFQIVCGLKILHENYLSHNDIKPGNILVSPTGKIKICDLGSTDKIERIRGNGTNGYLSPRAILKKNRTKEDDMYAVGIVFLELLTKKIGLFSTEGKNKEEQLKFILENYYDIKYGNYEWNQNINYNVIVNNIKEDKYNKFESKLKDNLFLDNEDENNKELIKNLLEINPTKRKTAEQVLNEKMFKDAKLYFVDSDFDYEEKDYQKFFSNDINEDIFKKHIETIREKFIGKTTLDKRQIKKPEVILEN